MRRLLTKNNKIDNSGFGTDPRILFCRWGNLLKWSLLVSGACWKWLKPQGSDRAPQIFGACSSVSCLEEGDWSSSTLFKAAQDQGKGKGHLTIPYWDEIL